MPKAANTSVKLATKHYQKLAEASKKSGLPISRLVYEAMSDYTENVMPTTVEAALRMRAPGIMSFCHAEIS